MEDEVQTIVMKDYFTELQKEMNFEVEPMEMEDDFLEFTLAEVISVPIFLNLNGILQLSFHKLAILFLLKNFT